MKKLAAFFWMIVTMAVLTGCGGEEVPFTAKTYEAENVTAVTVEVRDREIRVEASRDDKVHIDYYDSEKEFFEISEESGKLTMTAATDKEWKDYIGANAPREQRIITLALPQEALDALKLATTNENITLPSLAAGEIGLDVVNGNITFDTLNVEESMSLNGKNGDIRGTIQGSYDDFAMSCTTKKGECNLPESKAGGEKTLTVSANNGDVEIEFVK